MYRTAQRRTTNEAHPMASSGLVMTIPLAIASNPEDDSATAAFVFYKRGTAILIEPLDDT